MTLEMYVFSFSIIHMPMLHSLIKSNVQYLAWNATGTFSLIPYGRPWKDRRRLFARYFHPSVIDVYQPTQMKFVNDMLTILLELDASEDLSEILRK